MKRSVHSARSARRATFFGSLLAFWLLAAPSPAAPAAKTSTVVAVKGAKPQGKAGSQEGAKLQAKAGKPDAAKPEAKAAKVGTAAPASHGKQSATKGEPAKTQGKLVVAKAEPARPPIASKSEPRAKAEPAKPASSKTSAEPAKLVASRSKTSDASSTEQRVRAELAGRSRHHDAEPDDDVVPNRLLAASARRSLPESTPTSSTMASKVDVTKGAGKGEARGGLVRAGVRHNLTDGLDKNTPPPAKPGDTRKAKDKSKKEQPRKPPPPCLAPAVEVVRGTEKEMVHLAQCDGTAWPQGVRQLSVLGRQGSAKRPSTLTTDEDLGSIKKMDPGLAERVSTIVSHFVQKGQTARIEVISGYRPGSKGSYHSHARALDFRLMGTRNEDIVAYCKTLNDTGCGYYPNSHFVHVDVRDKGTGHISWIDASGPGESPRYVSRWPAPKDDAKNPEAGIVVVEEGATATGQATAPALPAEKSKPAADEILPPAVEPAEPSERAAAPPASDEGDGAKVATRAKPVPSVDSLPRLPDPND